MEGFVAAWELDASLGTDSDFRFRYQGCNIIDRNPDPADGLCSHLVDCLLTSDVFTVQIARAAYPTPPASFKASQDALFMWHRYHRCLEKRETLATMGYACSSWLQAQCEGRVNLATMYKIDRGVLDTLGTLTSDVGTPETARKFDNQSTYRAHTEKEVARVIAAIKALIRREAEFAGDPKRTFLPFTMADLPALS